MEDPWDDDPTEEEEPSSASFVQTAIFFECALAALAFVLGSIFSQQPPAGLEFLWHDLHQLAAALGWGLAATVPLAVTFGLLDRYGKRLFADLDRIATEQIGPMFEEVDLAGLLLVSLAAGVGEEMLFRGFLQGALTEGSIQPWGTWIAVAIAAVVFGLCHYLSFNYFLIATLMGAYLGLVWLWTGSLLAPIVTHAAYDFLALWYITRFKTDDVGDDDNS